MIKRKTAAPAPRQNRWRTYTLVTVCGLLTVAGVFFSGRQHFSWMDYGMRNSKLRKQIDDLQAEKRRLLLAREISLSPAEIKKAAKKAGIGDVPVADAPVAQLTTAPKDKVTPPATLASASTSAKPMVVKTAAVTPAPAAAVVAYKKVEKPVKTVKPTQAE